MKTAKIIPNPEQKLAVIRRYLHILALLQNNKDPINWNGTSLCETLQCEEYLFDNVMSDKNIRDYINKNLKEELGLDIDVGKGARRIELKSIPEKMLERLLQVYSSFVVSDSSRDLILKNFIKKHPHDCLWILGRIYFSILSKNSIQFDYITNSANKINKCIFNPYFILLRNNNLYLYGRHIKQDIPWILILNRISNLKILDKSFNDEIPDSNEVFKDTLGSFLGKKFHVTIEFDKEIQNQIEQFLSILEPKINDFGDGKKFKAEFKVSDGMYLCKQLFLYGNKVKIIKPQEIKDMMVSMLNESLSVYT